MRLNAVTRSVAVAATAVWSCFSLAATAPANAAAIHHPNAVTYQQVMTWHSGKCLDVDGGSQAIGARVQQYTCNGTVAQQWAREYTDSGYFLLEVAASGQCLTIMNGSQAPLAVADQEPCNGAYNQQWTERTSGVNGWPFLIARHSGMGLTIQSESLLNHARAVQDAQGNDGPDTLHAGDWQFQ